MSLAALNVEWAFPVLKGTHQVSVAAFGGLGYISEQSLTKTIALGAPYLDAGIAVHYAFTGSDAALIQSLLMTSAPLSVRVSLPFYVSRPAAGEQSIGGRWRVGISAAL